MISMLGIFIQGLVTNEGPATNWAKHVANPFGCNMATNIMNLPVNLA